MNASRPHPFNLIFGDTDPTRFTAIGEALGDRTSRDDFLLVAPALELMRELRPDEGLGEGVDEFVALVHAAVLFQRAGTHTVTLDDLATRELCSEEPTGKSAGNTEHTTESRYIQVAPRLIWGRLGSETQFEPVDGWFTRRIGDVLEVVACLGVHPDRPGLSVVAITGPRPHGIRRDDGSPLFAPAMPGGDQAGLFSVLSSEALLLLAWRAEEKVTE